MTKDELLKRLNELENIPLYDVYGGRQRNSNENQEIIVIRNKLTNL
tara:strand:- start:444 stop:581 length:138 start_codon:yes stop_codon:yes gene_type:complete